MSPLKCACPRCAARTHGVILKSHVAFGVVSTSHCVVPQRASTSHVCAVDVLPGPQPEDVFNARRKVRLLHVYYKVHNLEEPKPDPPVVLCGEVFPRKLRQDAIDVGLHVLVQDGSNWEFFEGSQQSH
jgi:hypothetical protein